MPSILRSCTKLSQFLLAVGAISAISIYVQARTDLFAVLIKSVGKSRYMAESSVVFYASLAVMSLIGTLSSFVIWFFALFTDSMYKEIRKFLPLGLNLMYALCWAAAFGSFIPEHLECSDNLDEVQRQIRQLAATPFDGIPMEALRARSAGWQKSKTASLAAIVMGALLFVVYFAMSIMLLAELHGRGDRKSQRSGSQTQKRRPQKRCNNTGTRGKNTRKREDVIV